MRNEVNDLELGSLTKGVIGAAIKVQKELGPGFLESIYECAMRVQLTEAKIDFKSQEEIPVLYHNTEVGKHRLDLLIENQLVVELKAVKSFEEIYFSQVRSYLKALNLKHGLLLNFATVPLGIKHVIFENQKNL